MSEENSKMNILYPLSKKQLLIFFDKNNTLIRLHDLYNKHLFREVRKQGYVVFGSELEPSNSLIIDRAVELMDREFAIDRGHKLKMFSYENSIVSFNYIANICPCGKINFRVGTNPYFTTLGHDSREIVGKFGVTFVSDQEPVAFYATPNQLILFTPVTPVLPV